MSDTHREIDLKRLTAHARTLLGIDLTPEQQRAFKRLAAILLDWNRHTNLTAITDPDEVEIRHFLDSMTVVRAVGFAPGCRVIDVGAGAGFPGLPLRIMFPKMALCLLEATGKKTEYLQHVVDTLELGNVRVVNMRAEEAGQDPAHREQYDVALARAVARLPVLVEYLLPLLKVGGRMVAMKGESAAQEVSAAGESLRQLGGEMRRLIPVELPEVADTHYLVLIEKVAASPARYPRRPGIPSRKPL